MSSKSFKVFAGAQVRWICAFPSSRRIREQRFVARNVLEGQIRSSPEERPIKSTDSSFHRLGAKIKNRRSGKRENPNQDDFQSDKPVGGALTFSRSVH
jgi:hypothetical protein